MQIDNPEISRHTSHDRDQIRTTVTLALREDIGDGDVTVRLIDSSRHSAATVLCREAGVLCGQDWFDECFRQLDQAVTVKWFLQDGQAILPDQILCEIHGPVRSILTGERTALNFLQTLSGTATTTQQMVSLIHPPTKLLDTRKTIPGLRYAQKYAVRCGGGTNHRMGLYDAFLIKENHIMACGSISTAVKNARNIRNDLIIEVEVETLKQLQEVIDCGADIALLDNFSFKDVEQAIKIHRGHTKLEVSGGITFEQVSAYSAMGIDYISSGALTKHLRALDLSMRLVTT